MTEKNVQTGHESDEDVSLRAQILKLISEAPEDTGLQPEPFDRYKAQRFDVKRGRRARRRLRPRRPRTVARLSPAIPGKTRL